MPIPQNAKAIYSFLVGAGFTPNAAAGICGNIEQESGGNPAAGSNPPGSGLIQELGFPSTASLAQNLQEILNYVKRNGSIADINAHASSPSAAALYFSERYERPLASAANNPNREQSAIDVANAAKSGNWPQSSNLANAATPSSGGSGGILGIPQEIISFFTDATKFILGSDSSGNPLTAPPWGGLMWLLTPSHWLRIVAFLVGVALALFAIHAFIAASKGEPVIDATGKIPIPVPIP